MGRRVVIELRGAGSPIAGSVSCDDGDWDFTGWLDLLCRLDALLAGSRAHDEGTEP